MLNNHIQPCVSGSELNNLPHRLGNVCSVRSMYLRVKKKQLKLECIRISPFMSCNFPCCYAFIKCKQVLVLSFLAFLTKLLQVDRVCLAKPATQTQYSTTISKATIFEKSWCSKTKFGSPFQETAYIPAIIFQQKIRRINFHH